MEVDRPAVDSGVDEEREEDSDDYGEPESRHRSQEVSHTASRERIPVPVPRQTASSVVDPPASLMSVANRELTEINAIQDEDARKIAFNLYLEKHDMKRELERARARQGTSTGSLEARKPTVFDGKDKKLQFKAWAKTARHYLQIKGQAGNTYVSSAMSWLEGPALAQAQLLTHNVPAHSWPHDDWVQEMQDGLYQTDPITEARHGLHHANLVGDSNFPAYASKFQSNLATLQQDAQSRMSVLDQIFLFRRGLEGTAYFQETEIDPTTNKQYTSLTAMMDKCRSI